MTVHKNKRNRGKPVLFTVLVVVGIGILVTVLLKGIDIALFNPKGLIAGQQRSLLIFSVAVLLEIAIPTLTLFYFFAWKYRESNQKATYDPHIRHGKLFVFSIWAIPFVFMLLLASMMVPSAYRLAPQKQIAADAKPLTIQVVALRWKWLFIYPEQHIASVNFMQIPVGTPVQFDLTADEAPMNSFWIPHLGGQLYAMTGHENRLNLMAETTGDYKGSAAEINGDGFAGMKFTARASSTEDFDQWVEQVKQSPDVLYTAQYNKLLTPSENNPAAFYSQAESDLFDTILLKYAGSHHHGG